MTDDRATAWRIVNASHVPDWERMSMVDTIAAALAEARGQLEICVGGTGVTDAEQQQAALVAIYYLTDDAKRAIEAQDLGEIRRQVNTIRDAALRGLGGERP